MKKKIICGDVIIGGNSPISIQSMTNVKTSNTKEVIEQSKQLIDAGCEIIRLAVPDFESAEAIEKIKKSINVPIVADIHFDYRLAIQSMKMGVDKVRINPGNIGNHENLRKVVCEAKERNIPIRIGVNSGSLEKNIIEKYGGVTSEGLAESAIDNVKILEAMDFENIVVSVKSSNVKINYEAHKILWDKIKYPLHIGITESGFGEQGKIKSSIGIGALLLENIGNTVRVSLTGDPVEEIYFAKKILAATGHRRMAIEIVSCPTCGRTKVDLEKIAKNTEKATNDIAEKIELNNLNPIKIAVMGCVVNGPGESREADFGIAGGDGEAVIFRKGKVVKKVSEAKVIDELVKIINESINI